MMLCPTRQEALRRRRRPVRQALAAVRYRCLRATLVVIDESTRGLAPIAPTRSRSTLEVDRQQAGKAMGLQAHRHPFDIVPVLACHQRYRSAAAGGRTGSGCVRLPRTQVGAAKCLSENVRQLMSSVWHTCDIPAHARRQCALAALDPLIFEAAAASSGLRFSISSQKTRHSSSASGRPNCAVVCGSQRVISRTNSDGQWERRGSLLARLWAQTNGLRILLSVVHSGG